MKVIEKNATVYKVVSKRGRQKLSDMARELPESWIVQYLKGRWAYPTQKGSALFAYTEQVNRHMYGGELETWRCTADIVDGELGHDGHVIMTWEWDNPRKLSEFWSDPSEYREPSRTVGVWCSRIKLEERV